MPDNGNRAPVNHHMPWNKGSDRGETSPATKAPFGRLEPDCSWRGEYVTSPCLT